MIDNRKTNEAVLSIIRESRERLMDTTKVPSAISSIADHILAMQKQNSQSLNQIQDNIDYLRSKVDNIEALLTRPEPVSSLTHMTLKRMSSTIGASGDTDVSSYLRLMAKQYCQTHNIEDQIQRTPEGGSRTYDYFPMAAAQYAMDAYREMKARGH